MAKDTTGLSIEERYDEVRQLIAVGKEKGYLLYDEVNELLPADITSSDELDDLFSTFGNAGIEVVDSGEGIPAEQLDRIFEKFAQVESRQGGRQMSSGLGLTFCKLVVDLHGGMIWVRSREGEGSAFYVQLPIKPVPVVFQM